MIKRLPLVFTPQPEGGFTVTSPVLPELITEGDTLEEAFANVSDALSAVLELYAEEGKTVPAGVEPPRECPIFGAVVKPHYLPRLAGRLACRSRSATTRQASLPAKRGEQRPLMIAWKNGHAHFPQ